MVRPLRLELAVLGVQAPGFGLRRLPGLLQQFLPAPLLAPRADQACQRAVSLHRDNRDFTCAAGGVELLHLGLACRQLLLYLSPLIA